MMAKTAMTSRQAQEPSAARIVSVHHANTGGETTNTWSAGGVTRLTDLTSLCVSLLSRPPAPVALPLAVATSLLEFCEDVSIGGAACNETN